MDPSSAATNRHAESLSVIGATIDDLVSGRQTDAFNHDVLIAVRRESRFVVSSTVVDGRYAIRPCYINPRTTVDYVDEFVGYCRVRGQTDAG